MSLKLRIRLLSVMVITAVLLTACGGSIPNKEERKSEKKLANYEQLLRFAKMSESGGDMQMAKLRYSRAFKMRPKEVAPIAGIGRTSFAIGDFDVAAQAYNKLVHLKPNDGQARRDYGKSPIRVGKANIALDQYQAALQINPKDFDAYNGLGVALNILGRHKDAENNYLNGLELAPDQLPLRNNLALSLALGGNYNEAIGILKQIVADRAATPTNRFNLALVYGLAGQDENAAALSKRDLKPSQIQNNLSLYKELRALSSKERAARIFGVK